MTFHEHDIEGSLKKNPTNNRIMYVIVYYLIISISGWRFCDIIHTNKQYFSKQVKNRCINRPHIYFKSAACAHVWNCGSDENTTYRHKILVPGNRKHVRMIFIFSSSVVYKIAKPNTPPDGFTLSRREREKLCLVSRLNCVARFQNKSTIVHHIHKQKYNTRAHFVLLKK